MHTVEINGGKNRVVPFPHPPPSPTLRGTLVLEWSPNTWRGGEGWARAAPRCRRTCRCERRSRLEHELWRATSPPLFIETQRLSVASQLSVAQEAAEARSLSVAADPRAH